MKKKSFREEFIDPTVGQIQSQIDVETRSLLLRLDKKIDMISLKISMQVVLMVVMAVTAVSILKGFGE